MFTEHSFEIWKMVCEIGVTVFFAIIAYNYHSTVENLRIADDRNSAYIERIGETARLNSLGISSLTEIARHNKEQIDRIWNAIEKKK